MYIPVKALLTTQKVELIGKKEFAATALDPDDEVFVVHVVFITSLNSAMHLFYQAPIALLKINMASTTILSQYPDFADIYSPNLIAEFLEHTRINNYIIEFINGKKSPYRLIYSLGPIELETLKIYIESNLANGFIRSSKFLASIPIFYI